ncbi:MULTISPECIES: 3-deoxy-7-phosphoheptulonate synthase [Streptomyces]|uniref:3-deoxy-7-phosphoheptulonate synthase n=1 Tax=Streptomyces TaxID=1883 RepID=UPI001E64619A|nr:MULTISPECIES: 3-deoxy-7-phosphoheptulonate synthase [Streptomyces]UFQ19067.1 3-deoxy-7-phosphoheptulonate synthase [Streptomyces huasconensis]WCL88686.1 3-deoxy-7-phosphoheptulonate synthase [Streptomyces sp. JCM 35825]
MRERIHARVPAPHGTTMCRIGDQLIVHVPGAQSVVAEVLNESGLVERTVADHSDAPLTDRQANPLGSVVALGGTATVGGVDFALIAGPCAVETHEQMSASAEMAKAGGAVALRGGAFKPRSSPYSFQGLGDEGLRIMAKVGTETGLPIVTEVVDPATVQLVAEHADVLQVGTRNAQNFSLLKAVGQAGRPVVLKRGFGCTVGEWLQAAEYVLAAGNPDVVLCERGIRSYEPATRFTLDLSAVAVVKHNSHLPVIVDPSHGTGHRHLVKPLALAAAAVGADGLLIDIHNDPASALCDADQALDRERWFDLTGALRGVLAGVGRGLTLREPELAGQA